MHKLVPVALDCFFGRDPVGRSLPKSCSKSATPLRTSQAATRMKREWNLGLEERIRAKEIKTEKY
jgi:hypothetical protein